MVIWGHCGLPPHLLCPVHHFHELFLSILEALVKEGAGFPHQVPDHVVVEKTVARGGERAAGHACPPQASLCAGWRLSPFIGGQDEVRDLLQVFLSIDHDRLGLVELHGVEDRGEEGHPVHGRRQLLQKPCRCYGSKNHWRGWQLLPELEAAASALV